MKPTKCCIVTGELRCHCFKEEEETTAPSIPIPLKETMRILFLRHAEFTAARVMHSLVDKQPDIQVALAHLLENQEDIGVALKPSIGDKKADTLIALLKEHIQLAGVVISEAVLNHDNQVLNPDTVLKEKIIALFAQGDRIATFLCALNPEKLPLDITKKMFLNHNQFVVDMTVARLQQNYEQEMRLYYPYQTEILVLSDSIVNAVQYK
jgi:hypothetical protein